MASSSPFFRTYGYPAEQGQVQLSVDIDVFSDKRGGSAVSFTASEGSELVAKYGSPVAALAACRDAIVRDLDALIKQSQDLT